MLSIVSFGGFSGVNISQSVAQKQRHEKDKYLAAIRKSCFVAI